MYLLPWSIVTVLIILLDTISKSLVENNMVLNTGDIPVIEGVFHLHFVKNPGATFGFMDEVSWAREFFIAVTFVLIFGIVIYTVVSKVKNKIYLASVSFIVGGGIGNLIDRMAFGEVVDFFEFRLINFAIFNVADCFVVIGVGLMIIYCIKEELKTKRKVAINGESDGNN